MVPYIQAVTGRNGAHRGIDSPEKYLAAHARWMARLEREGSLARVHESEVSLTACIYANEWVVVCECNSTNAVDPRWPNLACCFGCGAIHRTVIFPDDFESLERALLQRTYVVNRKWQPGVTVAQLQAENDALGEDL